MNIAMCFDIFHPFSNGIMTYHLDLARYLTQKGHTIIFIAPAHDKKSCIPSLQGIAIRYIPSTGLPLYPGLRICWPFSAGIKRLFKEMKIDILHITAPWFINLTCLNAAVHLKIPVVHTFHTRIYHPKLILNLVRFHILKKPVAYFSRKIWVNYFMTHSMVTTVPSLEVTNFLRSVYPKQDIRMIRNGIDHQKFNTFNPPDDLIKKYPLFNPGFTVLFVSRISREKELEVLIRAISLVEDSRVRLFIVGDGPDILLYKNLCSKLKLCSRIFFTGSIENQALLQSGLIQHSRALVNPSPSETFGMNLLEAIFCKTPVIVADIPAYKDLISNNGLVFQPGNPADLAKKIQQLLQNDQLHADCVKGAIALQDIFKNYNDLGKMEFLYNELKEQNHNHSCI